MSEDLPPSIEALTVRVQRLEADLAQLRAALADGGNPVPGAGVAPTTLASGPTGPWASLPNRGAFPPPRPLPAPQTWLRPARPIIERPRVEVTSETILKWAGVALVVLAVGFAVSTAISRGWIGPELQLVGALLFAAALVGSGLHLRATRLAWTHALCTGGVLALFTTIASDLFVDQTNSNLAMAALAVAAAAGIGLAQLVPSQLVATASLLGGTVAWSVLSYREPSFWRNLGWIGIASAAALVLALLHHWFALRFLTMAVGLLGIFVIALDAEGSPERLALCIAAVLWWTVLLRIPSIGELTSTWQQLEIQLATLSAPWAFGVLAVAFDLDNRSDTGRAALGVACATAAAAVGMRRWIQPAHLISLLVGASIQLSIGIAILATTDATFVALGIQAGGLVLLSRALGNDIRVLLNAILDGLIATMYVIVVTAQAWSENASWGEDVTHLALIGLVVVAGWLVENKKLTAFNDAPIRQMTGLGAVCLVLLWLGSVLVHLPQGQAVVSVSWAALGTVLLVAGTRQKVTELGAAGLAVLALTVSKLFVVDLQEVDTLWRAGLFLVVGLGIMRLGFLLPRLTRTETPPPPPPVDASPPSVSPS